MGQRMRLSWEIDSEESPVAVVDVSDAYPELARELMDVLLRYRGMGSSSAPAPAPAREPLTIRDEAHQLSDDEVRDILSQPEYRWEASTGRRPKSVTLPIDTWQDLLPVLARVSPDFAREVVEEIRNYRLQNSTSPRTGRGEGEGPETGGTPAAPPHPSPSPSRGTDKELTPVGA